MSDLKPHPLSSYLPEEAIIYVESLLRNTRTTVRITGERSSKHGSFSGRGRDGRYSIQLSKNNNSYAFLITFIHEIAHLKVFQKYGRRKQPHGEEWKACFRQLMIPLLEKNIFPEDLKHVLADHLVKPTASSTTDTHLVKALARYDKVSDNGKLYVESLEPGESFVFGHRKFIRKEVLRKRIKCIDEKTGKCYLFNPITKVTPLRS